jgi:hypothetical protein
MSLTERHVGLGAVVEPAGEHGEPQGRHEPSIAPSRAVRERGPACDERERERDDHHRRGHVRAQPRRAEHHADRECHARAYPRTEGPHDYIGRPSASRVAGVEHICSPRRPGPTLPPAVVLTRLWAVILAVLAVGCLAGMFLLSAGRSTDFSEADHTALRAVTAAGVAALEAEVASAPVRFASDVVADPELAKALAREDDAVPEGERTLAEILSVLAERVRLDHDSNMTVAVIDEKGQVKAVNGVAEPLVTELIGTQALQEVSAAESRVFSVTLETQVPGAENSSGMYVAFVSKAGPGGHRILAVEALRAGPESMLRRVLGTDHPGALVRRGKLLGDVIGDSTVSAEMETLAEKHRTEVPDVGASKVFVIGEGMNARIGALGRVPGPAGRGDNGVMLAVLSGHTAAAGRQDLAEALARARDEGGLSAANWVLLVFLLGISAALAVYLPWIEGLGPMQRLSRELNAVATGTQHSIFHDRYGGSAGEVARAAAAAHESLRQAYLAELEIDEEEVEGEEPAPRPRGRTTRARRTVTRSQRRVDTGRRSRVNKQIAETESVETEERPRASGSAARRLPGPPATDLSPPAVAGVPAMAAPPARPSPASAFAAPVAAPPVPPPMAPPPPTPPATSFARPPVPPPPSPAVRPAAPPPSPSLDLEAPTAPRAFVAAPEADEDGESELDEREAYYREVYDEFLQVKMACGEPTNNFSFDKFVKKLQKNTSDILRKRPDVQDVRFSVYVKDGKAALKAKIIKAPGPM